MRQRIPCRAWVRPRPGELHRPHHPVHGAPRPEHYEGRDRLHPEPRRDFLVPVNVHPREPYPRVLPRQALEHRVHHLARAAPLGPKVHQRGALCGDCPVKVPAVEVRDAGLRGSRFCCLSISSSFPCFILSISGSSAMPLLTWRSLNLCCLRPSKSCPDPAPGARPGGPRADHGRAWPPRALAPPPGHLPVPVYHARVALSLPHACPNACLSHPLLSPPFGCLAGRKLHTPTRARSPVTRQPGLSHSTERAHAHTVQGAGPSGQLRLGGYHVFKMVQYLTQ